MHRRRASHAGVSFMTDRDCTTNPVTHCVDCPAVPAVPGIPARTVYSADQGWTAGANSIDELDGDLHTVFGVAANGAIVIGFKDSRTDHTTPEAVRFGLFLRSQAGSQYVSVIERGVQCTMPIRRNADDMFEIRRYNGRVTYWRRPAADVPELLYTSTTRSREPVLLVNACLYLSGDAVA